jgi:hypothetical protein
MAANDRNQELIGMLRTVVTENPALREQVDLFRHDWEELDRLKVIAENFGDGADLDRVEAAEAGLNELGRDIVETMVNWLDSPALGVRSVEQVL